MAETKHSQDLEQSDDGTDVEEFCKRLEGIDKKYVSNGVQRTDDALEEARKQTMKIRQLASRPKSRIMMRKRRTG